MVDSSVFARLSDVRPRRRAAALTTGVVAVALTAAACTGPSAVSGPTAVASSSSSQAATGTPSGSVSSPSGTGTAVGADGTSSGGSGDSGGSTATCAERQLRATVDFQHPAGTINDQYHPVIVYFQNTSSSACVISGYPGAAVVDAQGNQVQQASRTLRGNALGLPTGQDALPVVTLQPGKYASAGIEGVSTKETGAAQAGCSGSAYPGIIVTPPNTTVPVPFTVPWSNCFTFEVHPVNTANNPPA